MFTRILDLFSNGNNNGDSDKVQVSDVIYYDEHNQHASNYNENDTFISSLMPIEIKPGEFYTKQQLHEVLQSLANCGMFKDIYLECTTNLDHTAKVTFYYTEKTWSSKDYFRCMTVGVKPPQTKPVGIDSDSTASNEARPCLLPPSIHEEVVEMMRDEGKEGLNGRMLCKIKERVEKWYHDEGYIAAQVRRFNNMYTKELVCELEEGNITKLVLFDGKNYIKELPVAWKKLCNQVEVGNVYNIKANKQCMKDLQLVWIEGNGGKGRGGKGRDEFSSIWIAKMGELDTYLDEIEEGVVVEIKLCYKDNSSTAQTDFFESLSLMNNFFNFVNFSRNNF